MLKLEELTEALHAALKECTPACRRFCTAGAEIEDGKYKVWHNGTGSRDTDEQMIYSAKILDLSKDVLATKLRVWVEGCHLGLPTDLNAAFETRGPAMRGWPWRAQITDCVRSEDAPKIDLGRVARTLIKPEHLALKTPATVNWPTGGLLP